MATMRKNDKARNKICGLPVYWSRPESALTAIRWILSESGYEIHGSPSILAHDHLGDHMVQFGLSRNGYRIETTLVFSWHWMPSGKQVEIVSYLT